MITFTFSTENSYVDDMYLRIARAIYTTLRDLYLENPRADIFRNNDDKSVVPVSVLCRLMSRYDGMISPESIRLIPSATDHQIRIVIDTHRFTVAQTVATWLVWHMVSQYATSYTIELESDIGITTVIQPEGWVDGKLSSILNYCEL